MRSVYVLPEVSLTDSVTKRIDNEDGELTNPELVVGFVGPIGVNIEDIIALVNVSLATVGYHGRLIHLTSELRPISLKREQDDSSFFERYRSLMDRANELRHRAGSNAAMAGVEITAIRRIREEITGFAGEQRDISPAYGTAYLIRQLKRPEEITTLRKVYGRKFILISAFGSDSDRRRVLMDKIARYDASAKTDDAVEHQAISLIAIDHNEKDVYTGQRVADAFHLGDLFVDGINTKNAKDTIDRFVRGFFGDNRTSPTKEEYGLYAASASALRSVDLSRQVGAAIFTPDGDVVAVGANEVPRAGGGTYWCDDPGEPARDADIGSDANQLRRNEIVFDLIDRMSQEELLSAKLSSMNSMQSRVDEITSRTRIQDAQIMDIIEYGRMIHAEMAALMEAARMGRSTKGAVLYCTTFPCHLCAKHIVAAGISKVVFLEPYPKSYAKRLHGDSITFDGATDPVRVVFKPFIGISPRRYRHIFEKERRRKDQNGRVRPWYEGVPAPRIEDRSAAYIENEAGAVVAALKGLGTNPSSAPKRP